MLRKLSIFARDLGTRGTYLGLLYGAPGIATMYGCIFVRDGSALNEHFYEGMVWPEILSLSGSQGPSISLVDFY